MTGRFLKIICVGVTATALAGCGGGDSTSDASTSPAVASRPSPLALYGATATVGEILDWAETRFPAFFPMEGRLPSTVLDAGNGTQYIYRYYPVSRNYLAVLAGDPALPVYVLGELTQGQLRKVGTVSGFTCLAAPQKCQLQTTPSAVNLAASNGGSQVTELQITVPYPGGGQWSANLESPSSSPWLSLRLYRMDSWLVTASGAGLAAGDYSAAIVVTWVKPTGETMTLRVPVSFRVT